MEIVLSILFLLIGYALGSVNAAVIISKVLYKEDIRTQGSGNAGLTNMLRVYGKGAAGLTFLIDFCKGIVACLLALLAASLLKESADVRSWYITAAGFGAILGHNFPLYFGFKGGKGVLTSFAVMLFIVPLPALIALAVFVMVVAVSRYVSLGSMLAALSLVAAVFFAGDFLGTQSGFTVVFVFCLAAAILLIVRHHANIGRLIKGKESKLSFKSKKK